MVFGRKTIGGCSYSGTSLAAFPQLSGLTYPRLPRRSARRALGRVSPESCGKNPEKTSSRLRPPVPSRRVVSETPEAGSESGPRAQIEISALVIPDFHPGLQPGIRIEIRAPDRNLLPIRVGRPGSARSARNGPATTPCEIFVVFSFRENRSDFIPRSSRPHLRP